MGMHTYGSEGKEREGVGESGRQDGPPTAQEGRRDNFSVGSGPRESARFTYWYGTAVCDVGGTVQGSNVDVGTPITISGAEHLQCADQT